MGNDLESLKRQLNAEIQELEVDRVRIEASLEEKRRLLKALNGLNEKTSTPVNNRGGKAKTMTALGPHVYEHSGKQFSKPGQLLDYLGVPHHFSKLNKGKDEAVRQIVRWAKRNPTEARDVTVILGDGSRLDLYDAVNRL